jgi:hypothetical protein
VSAQDELRMRAWSKLEFFDPGRTLRDLRAIELEIADKAMDPKVRALRTRKLRKYNEWRQAALFCHGMGGVLGTKLFFAPGEAESHDYVVMHARGDTKIFTPLQLKELVPVDVNAQVTLEGIIADLAKYAGSTDTVVAIYLNRRTSTDLTKLVVPSLNIGELWLFWAASPDLARWQLYGDLLKEPDVSDFTYPA